MSTFEIEKIVSYLTPFKNNLQLLYNWKADLEQLLNLEILDEAQLILLSSKTNFEREIQLKKILHNKLHHTISSNPELFDKICYWIIRDWGGIRTTTFEKTKICLERFLKTKETGFERIASVSKVAAYLYPQDFVIYDSRVAYSLNWILLSQNASSHFFPIPEGRNSKMNAFDMNTLIRLKYIDRYAPSDSNSLDKKKYISDIDKGLYFGKDEAYTQLNALVKQISKRLWEGDDEKTQHLYYTEMLLFAIADKAIFSDIIRHFKVTNTHLPDSIRGRSIYQRIIPTVCNLNNMLQNLQRQDWSYNLLEQWEKRCYGGYVIGEIESALKRSDEANWKEIFKQHLVNMPIDTIGPHPICIYMVAHFVEQTNDRTRRNFTKFILEKGVSEKENSATAIWQVGLHDGIYLDVLNADGTVKDWDFMRKWLG